MTRYEVYENLWNSFIGYLPLKKLEFLENGWKHRLENQKINPDTILDDVFKQNVYMTIVQVFSVPLNGRKYYEEDVDDEGIPYGPKREIPLEDVLFSRLANECGLTLSKDVLDKIIAKFYELKNQYDMEEFYNGQN